jgi:hypothetical protein
MSGLGYGSAGAICLGFTEVNPIHNKLKLAADNMMATETTPPELTTKTDVMEEYLGLLTETTGLLQSYTAVLQTDVGALKTATTTLQQADTGAAAGLLA